MRDVSRDPAYQVVCGLTVLRFVAALSLPFCGWAHAWRTAAIVFILGFATDMLDGALARAWKVATKSGERLDSLADAMLTTFALLALGIGGVWSWWVIVAVIVAGALALTVVEPRLRGDLLTVFIVVVPIVNLTLIAVLAAILVQQAGGDFGLALSLETGVATLIAFFKRDRIGDYLRMALARGKK